MSTPHQLVMPKLGQAMEFGSIAEWLSDDGAQVRVGQPVVSVETDKATYEIEAPASGVLRHLAAVGDEIPVGAALATIGDTSIAAVETAASVSAPPLANTPPGPPPMPSPSAVASARPLASPKARRLARTLNVDLRTVAAHRTDGLIVALDVEAAARAHAVAKAAVKEGVPLSRRRRVAADRLTRSWRQAPHFVQMIEVDATRLATAVSLMREGRLAGTLNDILIKAAADCLARFPAINARFEEDRLIPFANIGVGLAVATDEGLTVPVVRCADALSLEKVAAASQEVVAAARENRLKAGQVGGASLTISNLGRYGIAFGTPVLNLDEPVLVFVGAIEDRPVGRDGQVVLRAMTTLSVCFDHRVVDGLQAALFSQSLKQGLETLDGILPDDAGEPALRERQLEARSPSDGLAVSVRGGRHVWTVDEPTAIGGHDSGPDPVTLVLGGLLSCLIIAFKLAARRRKVPIDQLRGSLAATPQGKIKEATIRLEVWSHAEEAEVQRLLAPAKATCLVHDMLKPELLIALELVVHRLGGG
jgi:pyruvate dehydrogenase E2 component (dihydrolipoamide acetyltransferase)